jgi:hypothetical protein
MPYGAGGWDTKAFFMYGHASFHAMVQAEVGAWTELMMYSNNADVPNESITIRFIGMLSIMRGSYFLLF